MKLLPVFRYHRDPLGSGSVVPSDNRCEVCHQVSGYIYVGPVYSAEADEPVVCVRCIADGSAARQWDAVFTDPHPWVDEVPEQVAVEVLTRTPGFTGWQQDHWMALCGDAAIFLGPVGARELSGLPADATRALRNEPRHAGRPMKSNGTSRLSTGTERRPGICSGAAIAVRTSGTAISASQRRSSDTEHERASRRVRETGTGRWDQSFTFEPLAIRSGWVLLSSSACPGTPPKGGPSVSRVSATCLKAQRQRTT